MEEQDYKQVRIWLKRTSHIYNLVCEDPAAFLFFDHCERIQEEAPHSVCRLVVERRMKTSSKSLETVTDKTFVPLLLLQHTGNNLSLHQAISKYPEILKKMTRSGCTPIPTLHWSIYDLFSIGETPYKKLYFIPRYIKYLDSSIWNYYYPVYVWPSDETPIRESKDWKYNTLSRLFDLLDAIYEHARHHLYQLSNAQEFYELNSRIIQNAYLTGNAHKTYISPFIFHSEWEIKSQLAQKMVKKGAEIFRTNRWRILLLDDHANKPLNEEPTTPAQMQLPSWLPTKNWSPRQQQIQLCPTGKLKIIIDNLRTVESDINIAWNCPTPEELSLIQETLSDRQDRPDTPVQLHWNFTNEACSGSSTFNLAITCVRDVKSAECLLRFARYDLILLDYLLDAPNENEPEEREYSYTLLNRIKKQYERTEKNTTTETEKKNGSILGPLDRLYFIHISAFVPAISERLQEQFLLRDTTYWHIAQGACPINTPRLFLYYLYMLMEKRFTELLFDRDKEAPGSTLIDLLQTIFHDKPGSVKKNAIKNFNTLLDLRRKYDHIRKDIREEDFEEKNWLHRRGSLLIYSLFPDIHFYNNSFWEHIQHLVYLTAFGTSRQWPEMWEEYLFIKERLKQAERYSLPKPGRLRRPDKELPSEKIEDYIIQLKNT